jgi:seryl-tRNA synthetase
MDVLNPARGVAGRVEPVGTAAPGVFLHPPSYERVVADLRAAVEAMAGPATEPALTVPPVIARSVVERAGYVRSFPHLVGTVHSFGGGRREWLPLVRSADGGDWHREQAVTDLVLLPAACHHVYQFLADSAVTVPRRFCVHATCFRQERSTEPGRLRSFLMSELVFAGPADASLQWRDHWVERSTGWLRRLGLDVEVEVADDPFFGPGDHLLRDTQREQRLKWELRVPVDDGVVQAVASCNYHLDHYGEAFGFTVDGQPGHSACVGFGLDRLVLALAHRYGTDPRQWPGELGDVR